MLSPSNRGLRAALQKHGVAFEMPLAPDAVAGEGGGGGGGGGDDDVPMGGDAATLAQLNRGRGLNELQPDSELGRQHLLQQLDYKTGSTLVVHGAASLHALHEFLLSHRAAPHPYYLTLQLLSPQPFVHGSPCLLYTSPSPRDQRGSRMPSSA